jgi:hypothetical protein
MNTALKPQERSTGPRANLVHSAHQPNFLPWIGYFAKINQSHAFVFSDDVRFSKQQLTNRANFAGLNNQPFAWTIPVNKSSGVRIYEKLISSADRRIFDRGLARVENDYRGAAYYEDLCSLLEKIREFEQANENLSQFNINCITYIARQFDIDFLPILGSKLNLQAYSSNERLLVRARVLGIPNYLCGRGSAGYQDDNFLNAQGVKVTYVNYSEIAADFGADAEYSVLHLVAIYGLKKIREHFTKSVYRSAGSVG